MMEIELPKMHQSQQDMDLIDILWRQDIDLGAGREVFDYSHRQKECALQRQRALEEEKRQQLLREQEKALLAQLQLDEETGEFVPRPPPAAQPPPPAAPAEVTQNGLFAEDDGNALSFDECMQLLAESFPLVEAIETTPPALDAPTSVPAGSDGPDMMVPNQSPLPQQKTSQDLEQAWLELLSIPELQQCLSMQMEEVLEPTSFNPTGAQTELQDPNYNFYMPGLTDMVANTADTVCPAGYLNTFEGPLPSIIPPDNLNQMTLKGPEMNASFSPDGFCDMFYPGLVSAKVDGAAPVASGGNVALPLAELQSAPPLKPADVPEFGLGEGFESRKPEVVAEFVDSDSGLSLDASPDASSPEKSTCGDGSFGFSDSDVEEMDSDPGSAESDIADMFPLTFNPDAYQGAPAVATPPAQPPEAKPERPKTEPEEGSGHNKRPFTKDKHGKRRGESRLSRDEQRAQALHIPFTVDMIINLPVDDFNEMMSKQQLSEAQLALVRDIRRRGKNKVAAQNCRKRKMENIVGLEYELDSLKEERERLLREKTETGSSLREMKKQLSSLYLEVFSLLRDEEGKPYSPNEYSLQQTSDGTVFLVPRIKKTLIKPEGN
ncbi:nuclear factor erythroid 2-related factor 2a isoform X1 [Megalops cyprinoides]|uniref:nuclear factor erythroid 2-related factor 2a isoform X1 n=1 Tax=Megalops cyprinoides TaxID=118141 RepID=UPI0018645231|nr:nuclear factor erythroid 2-related factor 2a isoform X1 [Megalops cyprinoides]